MQVSTIEETVTLNSRIRYREIDGEGVLVHLNSGRVIVVNTMGLYIIQQLAKPMTRSQLIIAIIEAYQVSSAQAEADLKLFIDELELEKILSIVNNKSRT